MQDDKKEKSIVLQKLLYVIIAIISGLTIWVGGIIALIIVSISSVLLVLNSENLIFRNIGKSLVGGLIIFGLIFAMASYMYKVGVVK